MGGRASAPPQLEEEMWWLVQFLLLRPLQDTQFAWSVSLTRGEGGCDFHFMTTPYRRLECTVHSQLAVAGHAPFHLRPTKLEKKKILHTKMTTKIGGNVH